ncbi:MAG TPA: hypothetical protein VFG38_03385 [Pseudomonadales bacterium]|nr:hypothetical protein [Pseudomonadales bacterium]
MTRVAASVYCAITAVVVVFQSCLAAGAPWGAYAMGGVHPGEFSPALKIGAVVQASLLVAMAGVVLACAGVALPRWQRAARRWIWAIVAFAAVSLVLNLATPSAGERALWAPVAGALLLASALVAFDRTPSSDR